MTYTVLETTRIGDTGADNVLEVNVMKAENAGSDYLDKAYTWVDNACRQVYDEGWVPNVLTRKVTTDQVFDNCDNYTDQGNTWLDNNNWGDGTYCWIMKCDAQFAGADTGGWNQRRQAFSGTESGGLKEVACIAIMESFHPYINNNCSEAQKLMGDVSSSNDHSLGIRTTDYYITPMLGGYGEETATAGDCSNWESPYYDWTDNLTSCTVKAVSRSYDHAEGYH
jgi:hypothetical protein